MTRIPSVVGHLHSFVSVLFRVVFGRRRWFLGPCPVGLFAWFEGRKFSLLKVFYRRVEVGLGRLLRHEVSTDVFRSFFGSKDRVDSTLLRGVKG